jgi:hypothetical protein
MPRGPAIGPVGSSGISPLSNWSLFRRPNLSRARMIKVDPRKCFSDPLALEADRAILWGLGRAVEPDRDGAHLEGPPIGDGMHSLLRTLRKELRSVAEATDGAVVHGGQIATNMLRQ